MDNHIRQISAHDRSLVPAQAEVWITVVPDRQTPTTEIRGRLMGPFCPYSSTIEVAYPLRPLSPSQKPTEPTGMTVRAIIPEASLWEPQCPFLYHGPIELWQDGQFCDRVQLSHGLRSIRLDEQGLHVNGRALKLRGRRVAAASEQEVIGLRQAGYNLLLAPVDDSTLSLWEQADRLGFCMLGQVTADNGEFVRQVNQLSAHASCLGWVLDERMSLSLDRLPSGSLLGLAAVSVCSSAVLKRVAFLVGPARLANLGKPLLVEGEEPVPSLEGCQTLGSVL